MALNYLTGRVSRFGVGVPGFSTSGELTLDVAGAIGVGTTLPRAEIDTPNISIREQLIDSSGEEGPIGYFLAADADGVRWIQGNPGSLSRIRLYDNGVQVGFSDFTGLNFVAPDDEFIKITPNAQGDPDIADITFDIRWIKTEFGNNFGIATGFGTDGTYASIPGFGTSEAVGVTSVGIGTNQPQDDFQVGIGSTGVTINGPEGRLEAVTIKAQNVEIDGNITVESLVVDPGISTFRGNIDAQGISSFTGEVTIGVASIAQGFINDAGLGIATVGFATIGLGATTDPALIVNGISTFNGLVTTRYDLYVGNDLFVAGEQFIDQLNANNVLVTGIATINQTEILGAAITNLTVSGFSTLTDFTANVGVVTQLDAEEINAGVGSFGFAAIEDAEIGIVTIGIATVGEVDIGFASVTEADVGILTAGFAEVGVDSEAPGLIVNGISTFTGFSTFNSDVVVAGDLDVGGDLSFENLFGTNLIISGIATINVGVFTAINSEQLEVTGVSTLAQVEAGITTSSFLNVGVGTIFDLDVEVARIGILTGDFISYGIGTITDLESDLAIIEQGFFTNLFASSNSAINGVGFGSDLVTVSQNIEVLGISTFRGVGTFGTDLYVGNDLFVGGDTFFEQIFATNLDVSGVGTINFLNFNVGLGSTATFLEMEVGVGTITNFDSEVGFVSYLSADRLAVIDPLDPLPPQFTLPPPVGSAYVSQIVTNDITAANSATVGGGGLDVIGDTTTFTLNVQSQAYIEDLRFNTGVGTDLELESLRVGVVTIGEVDIGFASVTNAEVGVATIGDLLVTGVSTFEGQVEFEELVLINETVTGVASINQLEYNVGIGTSALIETAQIGVATVGLLSATDIEVTDLEVFQSRTGVATVGFASIGVSTETGALYVVGVNTFVGFTTFSGDVFVDGDFTVTGLQSVGQLDAAQSQIGILTVFRELNSNQDTNLNNVAIGGSFVASGLSTIGLSTFTPDGDLNVNRNFTAGLGTFYNLDVLSQFRTFNGIVTGVSTINILQLNGGYAVNFNVGDLVANTGFFTSFTVTGPSTFIGTTRFYPNARFETTVDILGQANINEAYIGFGSILDANIGVATVGFSTIDQAYIGILTTGTLTIETLDVLGVSTFRGNVEMQESLDVAGITTLSNARVAGVITAGIVTTPAAFVDILDFNDAIGGIASIGYLNVGVGSTLAGALNVTGVSTFTGLTTFIGDVFIDGDLSVTGFTSFTKIGADFGLIGILTVGQYLEANDLSVTGFTTLTDYEFRVGVGSTLTVVDANVTGILSTGNLFIDEDLTVGRNLSVIGITTLGDPLNPTAGFTTVTGDLYVGGDLFVQDDIFYDEIVGRNLLITGIATINQLEYGVGIGSTAIIDDLQFNVGVGSTLTVGNLDVGIATVGLASLTDVIVGGALTVVGVATFQSTVYVGPALEVADNLSVGGISTFNTVFAEDLFANSGVITNFQSQNPQVGILTAFGIEAGIATITTIEATFIDATSGIITATNADILGNITVSGLTSTNRLQVDTNAFITGLTSTGSLRVSGDSILDGDLTVGGDAFLNNVSISTANITDANVFDLNVQNSFYSTGVSTFAAGLDVLNSPLYADILNATSGVVTTLQGDNLTYVNGTFTNRVDASEIGVTTSISVGSTVYTQDLDVTGQATATFLDVTGVATAGILTVTSSAYIEQLNFNTGIGTQLTLENLIVENVSIGTVTVIDADVQFAQVGILTVTQQIDHELDATVTFAGRSATVDATPTTIFTVPSGYTSAEFTVTGVQGSDYTTSKIHALNTGTAVFFNEYSFISSGPDFAVFEVLASAGEMLLQATVSNGTPAQFTIHSVAHKA